jgi:predicted amidohydrolase
VGGKADIAVLSYEKEGFSFTDKEGHTFASETGYRCKLTIADGVVVFRD